MTKGQVFQGVTLFRCAYFSTAHHSIYRLTKNVCSGAFPLLLLLALLIRCSEVRGDTDFWQNSGSGAWEDPANWSLGLPKSNFWASISNPGWKAVAISANTASNYPGSMTVDKLLIGSPVDSYNVLLLNYAGYSVPFRANEIIVSNNAVFTVLGSMVQVTNTGTSDYRIEVSGTFNQGAYSSVNTTFLSIANFGPGTYNLTNGTLYGAQEYIGGAGYPAIFNHWGGYHTAISMRLVAAEYHLEDGALDGSIDFLLGASFRQDGGLCTANLNRWNYVLNNGILTNAGLSAAINADGSPQNCYLEQNGGSNLVTAISLGQAGSTDGGGGGYRLNNGRLITSNLSILGLGGFIQTGGVAQITGNLKMAGVWLFASRSVTWVDGYYNLAGGLLQCDSLQMAGGWFNQSGGTNLIAGTLSSSNQVAVATPGYNLSGGTLRDHNVTLENSMHQSGGLHHVETSLWLSGLNASGQTPVTYELGGGVLSASSIVISNSAMFAHTNGNVLNNNLLVLASGSWLCATGITQLGHLALDTVGAASTSYLDLAPNSTMRFLNSSGQAWNPAARLIIRNWQGSGTATNSLNFGSAGLTDAQVAQTLFQDPNGMGTGLYPARLLSNGDLVPVLFLSWQLAAGKLVLQWPADAFLQNATNVSGPYFDLTGVTSPYTNQFTSPQLFFRLRR